MEDYYQILGISPQATQSEVRHSFRKLALLYHPDRNKTLEAEERFKEINRAYEVISNPEKRMLYDLSHSQGFALPTVPQPAHRDPAYRRRRAATYGHRVARPNAKDLMAEYLPKFRWVCYLALIITLTMAIDYSLPFRSFSDDIVEINRIYRTGRAGGMIYDHDELLTKNGTIIKLRETDVAFFKKVDHINIQQTYVLKKNVIAATPSGTHKVRVAAIYGNLAFIPLILFISALLGSTMRNNVEFAFNLSVVSFVLLIIVAFLLIN
jgi:hypothetical protein